MYYDNDVDAILDCRTLVRERQWRLLCVSLLVWLLIGVLMVLAAPFVLIVAVWDGGKKIVLKLRRLAADLLRPKDVVRARHTEPQSDLVASFVEYETLLVKGKETMGARVALIRELAHVEEELEDLRILSAEIRKLRADNERPRRRDAILSTRLRAERRRERERKEEEEGGTE